MTLAPHSRGRLLRFTTREVRVVVDRGSASFDVEPLGEGRFMVDTPHARVEVIGTRFTVTVQDRHPCTDVSVARGVVQAAVLPVGDRVVLRRGQSHTLCLAPSPTSNHDPERELQQALRLLVSGKDYPQVARSLTSYLRRHPNGVFAEDALFHLIFVRQRLGQEPEARRLAKDFLVRFSEGERARRVRVFIKKLNQDNSHDPGRRSPTSLEM
jgi:hypothetical protein